MFNELEDLKGKTITGILVGEKDGSLCIETTEGDFCYECEADCCSSTFISNIMTNVSITIQDVFGKKILDIPDMGYEHQRDGELKIYGHELILENGSLFITYRNESNGYYGGNLSKTDEFNKETATRITEPFESRYV